MLFLEAQGHALPQHPQIKSASSLSRFLLEHYWNGAILDSVEAAVNWAANMTWKGLKPFLPTRPI